MMRAVVRGFEEDLMADGEPADLASVQDADPWTSVEWVCSWGRRDRYCRWSFLVTPPGRQADDTSMDDLAAW